MPHQDDPLIRIATVVKIDDSFAWIDIGSKVEAKIPLSEWSADEPTPNLGDRFDVLIDPDNGPLIATRAFVRRTPSLDLKQAISHYSVGQTVHGRVARQIANGFLVDIGVNAFLPFECAPEATPDDIVEKAFIFRITEIDQENRSIQLTAIN